jgi:glutathione S-transferase
MKLYYTPGACSLSPHIALREAGLPFTLQKVDLAKKTVETGEDYNRVNAKGSVPTLVLDNGEKLTEGPAIVQYIADQKPAAGIAPAAGTMERYRLQEWLNYITSELHKPMGSMFNPAQTAEWKEAVKFTVADGYLFTILGWAKFVNFDLSKWPSLQQYMARIGSRPKVVEALKAEGLMS